jgi:hypothetical protein
MAGLGKLQLTLVSSSPPATVATAAVRVTALPESPLNMTRSRGTEVSLSQISCAPTWLKETTGWVAMVTGMLVAYGASQSAVPAVKAPPTAVKPAGQPLRGSVQVTTKLWADVDRAVGWQQWTNGRAAACLHIGRKV